MRNLLSIFLVLFFALVSSQVEAQHRRARTNRVKRKVIVKKKGVRANRLRRKVVVHHRYRHLPRRGSVVKSLHRSAIAINYRGIRYRYHSGIWYRPNGTKWMIVSPGYGVHIRRLPIGYNSIVYRSNTYYYYYGTYYIQKNGEYEVVRAPTGIEVDSLPDGYEKITLNNEQYYKLDEVYYQSTLNKEEKEVLVVVTPPSH